jgi:hypothetical protein
MEIPFPITQKKLQLTKMFIFFNYEGNVYYEDASQGQTINNTSILKFLDVSVMWCFINGYKSGKPAQGKFSLQLKKSWIVY